jgi:hypothetical protein
MMYHIVYTRTHVQALHYLAQVPSNRPLMKSEVGLLISIRRIISRSVSTVYYSYSATAWIGGGGRGEVEMSDVKYVGHSCTYMYYVPVAIYHA